MNQIEFNKTIDEVMGKDPIEMCIKYYEGLVQLNVDEIAQRKKDINKLNRSINRLKSEQPTAIKKIGGEL